MSADADTGGRLDRCLFATEVAVVDGGQMSQKLVRIVNSETGMSTAEYAVGTVAAAGFGGLLLKLLTSPEVQSLLWSVVQKAFSWIGG